MNEISENANKTPIEIALGIDENGCTTARKLYEFLELEQKNFSHWVKRNITCNEFATENEDFVRFVINDETPTGGKIKREDYRLTAHFAKKLSMKGTGKKQSWQGNTSLSLRKRQRNTRKSNPLTALPYPRNCKCFTP